MWKLHVKKKIPCDFMCHVFLSTCEKCQSHECVGLMWKCTFETYTINLLFISIYTKHKHIPVFHKCTKIYLNILLELETSVNIFRSKKNNNNKTLDYIVPSESNVVSSPGCVQNNLHQSTLSGKCGAWARGESTFLTSWLCRKEEGDECHGDGDNRDNRVNRSWGAQGQGFVWNQSTFLSRAKLF